MCIAISLPREFHQLRELIELTIVDTVLFRSKEKLIRLAFDVFVRNKSDQTIQLDLTHVFGVRCASLATADFIRGDFKEDERAQLVQQIYGNSFGFDEQSGEVGFEDPVETSFDAPSLTARALAFPAERIPKSFLAVDPSCLSEPNRPAYFVSDRGEHVPPIFPLRDFLAAELKLDPSSDRPFSTFRIQPILPDSEQEGEGTFFRVTLELDGAIYDKLIDHEDAPFEITSARHMERYIRHNLLDRRFAHWERDAERGPWFQRYASFFEEHFVEGLIDPSCYQIIVGQPTAEAESNRTDSMQPEDWNRYVCVRPTSSQIGERYVADPNARSKSLWFHAWGSDFSLVLKYGQPPQPSSLGDGGESGFRGLLSADAAVPLLD